MDIKNVNHIELHFNHGGNLEELLFMNHDCEIVIKNLKQDITYVAMNNVNEYLHVMYQK